MDFNRPLVCLCISVIVGIITFDIFNNFKIGAVLIAALFIMLIFIFFDKLVTALCICMMVISFMNTYYYYNMYEESNILEVTVSEIGYKCYGDLNNRRVLLQGDIESFTEGNEFIIKGSYKNMPSSSDGVAGVVYVDSVIKCNETIQGKIISNNDFIYEKLKAILGEKEASIVCSMSFGNDKYLNKNIKNEFKEYGIVHVFSVSGFHMAIVYGITNMIVGFLGSTIIAILYVILTGMKSSAERAFIMMFILILGKKVKKNYDPLSSICLSAIILLISRPYYIYSLGFILSYSSTLGIILFYKRIRRALYRIRGKIGDAISISLSAQVFSLPIIILQIGDFATSFLLGNVVLMPIISLIIILGNIAFVVSRIDFIFNFIAMILHYLIISLQGAVTISNPFSLPQIHIFNIIAIIYCILLCSLFFYKKDIKKVLYAPIPLFIWFICFNYCFDTRISFLKQGFNKGIYIESGFSKTLIYHDNGYNVWNHIDTTATVDPSKCGFVEGDGNKIIFNKSLDKVTITSKDKSIYATWKSDYNENIKRNNSSSYDIINIDDNCNIIILRRGNVIFRKQ